MPRRVNTSVAGAVLAARESTTLVMPEVGTLNEAESKIFAGLMNELPSDQRNRTSTRLMCAELARATVESALLADQLKAEGLTYRMSNGVHAAHPAIAIRAQASTRITAMIAKLGLSCDASGDKTERNNRLQAEQSVRGPLRLATKTDAPPPNWAELLKAEK